MATFEVHKVESEQALHAAYLVMRELRPHLTDAENFITAFIARLNRVIACWASGRIKSYWLWRATGSLKISSTGVFCMWMIL
jgi:hypothetical protein